MKRLLFIVLSVVVLASCSKDDPKPAVNKLVGSWKITDAKATILSNGVSMTTYMIGLGFSAEDAAAFEQSIASTFESAYQDGVLEFKSDGNWTGNGQAGTWKLSDDQKTLTLTNSVASGVETKATVVSFSDTDMKLDVPISFSEDSGFSIDEASKVALTLKKQ